MQPYLPTGARRAAATSGQQAILTSALKMPRLSNKPGQLPTKGVTMKRQTSEAWKKQTPKGLAMNNTQYGCLREIGGAR